MPKVSSVIKDISFLHLIMNQENIVLVYVGEFSQDMVKAMLKYTEEKLSASGIHDLTRKKIFNVMTEMLQNLSKHHQANHELKYEKLPAIFLLNENTDSFSIITGNDIDPESVEKVTSKIDLINGMNKEEIKEYYKKMRLNSVISDVGGAGLGFIDIIRKSENPLLYQVTDGTPQKFFILKSTINKL